MNRLHWKKHGLSPVAACLFWAMACFAAPAASFTASLDRDTIALGENATLLLTFEGGSPQDVPQLPDIPGLQFSYVGPSSEFNFINGQSSSKVVHHFTVTPQKAGDFVIPALTADL